MLKLQKMLQINKKVSITIFREEFCQSMTKKVILLDRTNQNNNNREQVITMMNKVYLQIDKINKKTNTMK